MKSIIDIKNVSKKFKDVEILKNINFKIYDNEIIGLIGRNGSGKTVLLKIIAGLYSQDSGEIIFDEDIDVKKDLGIMIETGFLPNQTGLKNLELIASLRNLITKKDCYNILFSVGLDPFSNTKYKYFSTGMKQRMALAQAIMEDPKIIILDEPFNGIDEVSINQFRELLLSLKSNGKTLIITSHNQEDIELLCDRVFKMENSSIKEVKYDKEKN